MARSSVFDKTCEELEARTALGRLAVRGTVRIGLKAAGLDVESVDAKQMGVVLERLLPGELESRGVADARELCATVARLLAGQHFDVALDRSGAAASAIGRLGS